MLRLPYYHATFVDQNGVYKQIVDSNSHPFIWMDIEFNTFNRRWILLNWKQINDTEYHYFKQYEKNI